jgi:Fe-S-cluster containining protein
MTPTLKQFVPSQVCLSCEGCCRFLLSDSPWRPKTGEQEAPEGVDQLGYVKTTPQGEHHQCIFFSKKDGTCGIYSKRPFECALYPFVVSGTDHGVKVYMHLACPYIQEKEISPELQDYISYLQDYFKQPSTKAFLKSNRRLLHDYSPFENELKFLFNIEVEV